ncbi:MAG: MarR family transcriptional regulator [Nitrospirae bacterium]|nr:MarR family transcriptional regulator [Nitrospirota bacterium]MBI3351671.1 MarR family transcriptional regulator [Nitrospirota bacterium]
MSEPSPFKHDKADESAGFLLWKITTLWQRKLAEVLGEFGITQTQFAIMASLRWFEQTRQPTTQAHIVEHAKIDKMTVSKSIRQLEKNGFVLRKQSHLDSRAVNIRFTGHGKRIIAKAIVAIENADHDFFSCLTRKELRIYKSLTMTVIANGDKLSF